MAGGVAPSKWKQTGRSVARRRLARKPKFRMPTKTFGSTWATSCELMEVTAALACAAGDPNLAVQVKTGTGRFFADLKKPPYKLLFNPSVSGAKAFNATTTHRAIEGWIETKKRNLSKKSVCAFGAFDALASNRPIQNYSFSGKTTECRRCNVRLLSPRIGRVNRRNLVLSVAY